MESHLTSTTAKQRVAIVKNLAYFYLSLSLFYHYYYYSRKILNESNDTFQVRRHQTRLLLDNARRCTASHPNTVTSWLLKKVRLQLNFVWFKCKFRRFFHNSSPPPPQNRRPSTYLRKGRKRLVVRRTRWDERSFSINVCWGAASHRRSLITSSST